ncbi:MAG: hypothetical protein PWQ50_123, partial [Methanolobus sp.]|nr:hypothetical protein [Methanolobus sp.]
MRLFRLKQNLLKLKITNEFDEPETEEISLEEETIDTKTGLSDASTHETVAVELQEEETESLAVDEDDVIGELADLILPDAEPVNIDDLKSKIDDVYIPSFKDTIEEDRDSFWKDTVSEIYKEEAIEEDMFIEEE